MMNTAQKITTDQVSAEEVLHGLGLDIPLLTEAILKGQAKRNEATPNHPANTGGTYFYHETVRAVRDRLVPMGWKRERVGNLELTLSPCRKIALAVSGGDHNTGMPDKDPCTRNPKGSQTRRVVSHNEHQYTFDFEPDFAVPDEVKSGTHYDYEVWWLLSFLDKALKQIRSELSLPIGMNEMNRISKWRHRVLLPSVSLSDTDHIGTGSEESYSEEVDFEVQPRKYE